jgi:hypothetical protein
MKRLSFPLRLVQASSAQARDASAYCPFGSFPFPKALKFGLLDFFILLPIPFIFKSRTHNK